MMMTMMFIDTMMIMMMMIIFDDVVQSCRWPEKAERSRGWAEGFRGWAERSGWSAEGRIEDCETCFYIFV